MDKRLIEDSLPLKEINLNAASESNIKRGHIKNLHTWWARRPLTVCRAAVYASLVPAPKDDKERKEQHEFIKKLVNWDTLKPDHPDHWVIEEAKRRILEANGGVPPKVLDPFAGGGSIPLEAQRLGCETYASDLNPVAYIILLCTLYYPQKYAHLRYLEKDPMGNEYDAGPKLVHDVKKWGKWIYNRVKKEIGHLYDTGNPDETPVAYIWARTVTCPNPACRSKIPLVRQWWLCKKKDKKVAIKPITKSKEKRVAFEIVKNSEIDFNPSKGTIIRGNTACLCCGQVTPVNDIRQMFRDKKFEDTLMAIISVKDGNREKLYRIPNENDIVSIRKSLEVYERILNEEVRNLLEIPEELLPPVGTLGFRINNYGFTNWGSLFNPRQTASLVIMNRYVRHIYESLRKEHDDDYSKTIALYLGMMVSRFSGFNASFCVLNSTGGRGVTHVFGRQALPMVWDYAETNPFNPLGANLKSCIDSIVKILDTAIKEIGRIGHISRYSAEKISNNFKQFDAIITDPPYYDAVPYADLSDYFYVWLKRSIGSLYPEVFSTKLTPKRSEIIQNPIQNKDRQFFEMKMEEFFRQVYNVLSNNGIFVLVYAHKSTEAWETLLKGLLKNEIIVTSSWPLHTERPGRLRAQDSAALASSVFIVCRKRKAIKDGFADDVERELKDILYERLEYFWSQGIRGSDFFMSAIGPAVQVFGKYKKVYTLEGEELTVADLLLKVREIVSDFALERIVKGRGGYSIDDDSRFYLLWRWAFGNAIMPAGEVIPMAQSLGVEFNDLVSKSGVLQKKGDKVTLKGPMDRKDEKKLGESIGLQDASPTGFPPLIDVLHRAIHLWQAGDRQELSNLIARSVPGGRDSLEQLAQSIIDVLPDDDKEATLYVNFLTGARQLPEAEKAGAEQLELGV